MPFNITIDHATTAAPSVVSEGSDRAHLPAPSTHSHHSASDRESYSQSDQEHDDPRPLPLYYPAELHEEELAPSDSASRPGSHRSYPRTSTDPSRSSSAARRQPIRRRTGQHRDPVDYNHRGRAPSSPESVDSAEEYARAAYPRLGPPNRHSYYDGTHMMVQPGYAHSSSSGGNSYGYPPVPSNHVVPYAPQSPPPAPYGPQYGHMGQPPPAGYPPTPHVYPPPPISHHAGGSHISAAYMTSQYAVPPMMPYQHGYFSSHYQQPFPQYMDPYSRVITPQHHTSTPPTAAPAASVPASAAAELVAPAAPAIDQEEVIKRMEAILAAERAERLARETAEKEEKLAREIAEREERLRIEKQKEADAKAAIDQEEIVKRVEAMLLAEREERLAREAKKEADAKAAADEAAAIAERAASDAKIAEEAAAKAAAAAKEEAEKKAAAEAAQAKEEAEAKLAEAQAKSAEAEAAAAKAKADAEAAEAKIPPPPAEKKAPIRFKDAVGRKFNFPFHLCAKWSGMEELIRQAFLHVEVIGPHVQDGHYDLLGPNGEIILPQVWETVIEPDWTITMAMWPMPPEPPPPEEPPEPAPPPSLDESIINIEDIIGKKHKPNKGPGSAKSASKKNLDPLTRWLIGSSKPAKGGAKPLKAEKKPDVAAGFQRAAGHDQSGCRVM